MVSLLSYFSSAGIVAGGEDDREVIDNDDVEHVTLLTAPRYTGPGRVLLVWVGGCRPSYHGQKSQVTITDITMTSLQFWLTTKNMDMGIFKGLVRLDVTTG